MTLVFKFWMSFQKPCLRNQRRVDFSPTRKIVPEAQLISAQTTASGIFHFRLVWQYLWCNSPILAAVSGSDQALWRQGFLNQKVPLPEPIAWILTPTAHTDHLRHILIHWLMAKQVDLNIT